MARDFAHAGFTAQMSLPNESFPATFLGPDEWALNPYPAALTAAFTLWKIWLADSPKTGAFESITASLGRIASRASTAARTR